MGLGDQGGVLPSSAQSARLMTYRGLGHSLRFILASLLAVWCGGMSRGTPNTMRF
jgi:hypothetical protein